MPTLKPFVPTATRPWDRRLARHLLERAGFGGGAAEVDELVKLGPADAVARLLHAPPEPEARPAFLELDLKPGAFQGLTPAERREQAKQLQRQARQAVASLKGWWLNRMITTAQPLDEKLTLFWHGHFTTEADKVKNAAELYTQNQLFRRQGKGLFRELALAVSQDPAMLRYLDNEDNRKGHPNENYARELMELFTLGIGHYTETDVLETARAFTGWTVRRARGAKLVGEPGFLVDERQHDDGPKTILGHTGNYDGAAVIDLLLEQPSCAPFLCRKLWRFFVHDELDAEAEAGLTSLANVFRASGYQLAPILETILRSDLFYQERNLGARIKSPVELVVGTCRKLGVKPDDRQALLLAYSLRMLGQDLFDPPNVAGWHGGKEWINTSTLLQRYNLIHLLLNGGQAAPAGRRANRQGRTTGGLAGELAVPAFTGPGELVHLLVEEFLAVEPSAEQRRAMEQYLAGVLQERGAEEQAWRLGIHLVMSSPHYQVC